MREILVVKYKIASFVEARKIVESYVKDNTYANIAQRAKPISNNYNQPDKEKAIIKFNVQLGPNDCPHFQELLKKFYC